MIETLNISDILMALKDAEFYLIGIDGTDGSGKTTLAALISKALGWPHINLDDHIDKNQGQYVNHVYYPAVREIINSALSPIIIEGVCLLAIAERLELTFDTFIYVKRINSYGSWIDEEDCDVTEDIEEFMERKKENLNKFVHANDYLEGKIFSNDAALPEITEEIIRYHHSYRPHEKANFIYKRID